MTCGIWFATEQTDSDIEQFFLDAVHQKEPGHRINEPDFVQPDRTMVYIGVAEAGTRLYSGLLILNRTSQE